METLRLESILRIHVKMVVKDAGFQTFSIRGEPVSKDSFIRLLLNNGGCMFTLAFTEPDNMSKTVRTDGKDVWTEDFFGDRIIR